jgi:hypothetical protein
MTDNLATLPTDNTPLTPDEQMVINKFLMPPATDWSRIRSPLILGFVFAVLCLPAVDQILSKMFKSPTLVLLIKTILFIAIAYMVEKSLINT